MGFSEPKNPMNVIGLMLPRLDMACNQDFQFFHQVVVQLREWELTVHKVHLLSYLESNLELFAVAQ